MDWYPDDVVIWPTPSDIDKEIARRINQGAWSDVWAGNTDTDKAWRDK